MCKFISWINDRALKLNTTFVVPKKAPHNPNELPFDHIPKVKRLVSEVKLNYFCVPSLKVRRSLGAKRRAGNTTAALKNEAP